MLMPDVEGRRRKLAKRAWPPRPDAVSPWRGCDVILWAGKALRLVPLVHRAGPPGRARSRRAAQGRGPEALSRRMGAGPGPGGPAGGCRGPAWQQGVRGLPRAEGPWAVAGGRAAG